MVQASHSLEKEPRRNESDQACFMVQENDSLKVTSDTHLDDYDSSFIVDNVMDAQVLNEELSKFCEKLLSKYKVLKTKVLI